MLKYVFIVSSNGTTVICFSVSPTMQFSMMFIPPLRAMVSPSLAAAIAACNSSKDETTTGVSDCESSEDSSSSVASAVVENREKSSKQESSAESKRFLLFMGAATFLYFLERSKPTMFTIAAISCSFNPETSTKKRRFPHNR